jgi:uncharacterized Tic20 family protein
MSPATNQLTEQDERNYTSLMNLLGIFFGFLPSLIGYLVWKDQSEFLKRNLASALNFQITMAIVQVVGVVLIFTLGIINLAAWVLMLIFSIMAFVKTREGSDYKYPLSIAFIK